MNKKRLIQCGDLVSPKHGCASYLTVDKKYRIRKINSNMFNILDDVSDEISCDLRGCGHSPKGWHIHSTPQDEVEDNVENLIEIL